MQHVLTATQYSTTASRSGASEREEAAERGADKDAVQTIEERVKAEIKAGKQPVALPPEQISNFVSKLFPLPYGDEAKGKDGQPHANNVGLISKFMRSGGSCFPSALEFLPLPRV